MTRVRLTTAKRAVAETVLELAPEAKVGKQVFDLPDGFVARFMAAQEEWWTMQGQLAQYLVPRPVGSPSGRIGRPEYRPGSGRGTPHPKGAA